MIDREYLIMNEWDMNLAEAELVALGERRATYFITNDSALNLVRGQQVVRVMENHIYAEVYEGKIESIEGNEVIIACLQNISEKMRKDFKIRCNFKAFMTPVPDWKRMEMEPPEDAEEGVPIEITARDVSCGGIGFHCNDECSFKPIYELALPILKNPQMVRFKLVRCDYDEAENRYLCGARFMNLSLKEESLLRKTILAMQVRERKRIKEMSDWDELPDKFNSASGN